MKNWKISTRLAGAFAAMVLLVLVLGVISLVRSGHQREALNDVVGVRIPVTKALAALDSGVNEQAIQYRTWPSGTPMRCASVPPPRSPRPAKP